VAKEIFAGDHGTTYGGNLLATRAALYVLGELERVAPQIRETGALFEQKLNALQNKHRVVTGVKGAGLMQGLHLSVDAQPVIEAALRSGLLVNRTAEKVVRMLPPLTVTAAEIDEAVSILDGALASVTVEEVKA
jgi:acetylornithine/succinyldiaminopimelate/putrescine aminotransferase